MKFCTKCSAQLQDDAQFCTGCGTQQSQATTQEHPSNVKIITAGACPHCGKSFKPEGSTLDGLLKFVSKIVMIFFVIFALLTVIVLLGEEGSAWVFALVTGLIWMALKFARKKVQEKMDAQPCPHCGRNKKGELIGEPEKAPFQAPARASASNAALEKGMKTCAKCRASNAAGNKTCTDCGFRFGSVVMAEEGNKKIGLTTCPGCGSVYKVHQSKGLGVLLVVVGLLLLTYIIWPTLILSTLCVVLGVMQLSGKFLALTPKKCTVCHRTPAQVAAERRAQWWDNRLLSRNETVFNRFFAALANHMKVNLFPLLVVVPWILFLVTIFTPHRFTASVYDIADRSRDLLYGDAVLNFSGEGGMISLIGLSVCMLVTLVSSFFAKARRNGFSLFTGLVAFGFDVALIVRNGTIREFTQKYEGINYECIYDLGATNVWLALAGVVLLVAVFFATFVEREKHYSKLKSTN